MKNKKRAKWLKPRHRFVRNFFGFVLKPYIVHKYGIKIEPFKEQNDRQYLVLYNHQTGFDQFFVGLAFKCPIYYLATEDIFSLGFLSSLLRYLVAPIPIKKQTTDVQAILNCIRVAKEGGTIAIAPEGNRTYSGRTEFMSPSIASLARKMKLPIALYRIEGGYGVQPRWSDVVRKGKMRSYVSKVIEHEEYASLSDDELFKLIEEGLYVDEAKDDACFYHKKNAEYLERVLYVCPDCGLSTFKSHKCTVKCLKCGKEVEYLPSKELKGIGYDLPFRFVADWYNYQNDYINNLDTIADCSAPLYSESANISEVIPNKKKNLIEKNAPIQLYGDKITIEFGGKKTVFNFSETTALSVLGKNKLNIYHGDKIYQLKGSKSFNALKYVNLYYRYKNIIKGDSNVKFLGL